MGVVWKPIMADAVKRHATYADLLAVPPHLVAEILASELVTHRRPAPRHGSAASELGVELGAAFGRGRGGPGGWVFLDEPELHLGSHVAVPDIAGWRRERMQQWPETAYIELAPDWLCEVLSPSTVAYDRGIKRRIYAEAGVRHIWLLDPVTKQLEAFRLEGRNWLLLGTVSAGETVSLEPFDAISFPLDDLFPLDEAPPAPTT